MQEINLYEKDRFYLDKDLIFFLNGFYQIEKDLSILINQ